MFLADKVNAGYFFIPDLLAEFSASGAMHESPSLQLTDLK